MTGAGSIEAHDCYALRDDVSKPLPLVLKGEHMPSFFELQAYFWREYVHLAIEVDREFTRMRRMLT